MKIFDDKENPARSRLMAHIEWMLDREEKQDAKMTRIANKDAYLSWRVGYRGALLDVLNVLTANRCPKGRDGED